VDLTALDAKPERTDATESAPAPRRRWWEFWKPAA